MPWVIFIGKKINRGQPGTAPKYFRNLWSGKGDLGPLQHDFVPELALGFGVRVLVNLIFKSHCEMLKSRIRKTM